MRSRAGELGLVRRQVDLDDLEQLQAQIDRNSRMRGSVQLTSGKSRPKAGIEITYELNAELATLSAM